MKLTKGVAIAASVVTLMTAGVAAALLFAAGSTFAAPGPLLAMQTPSRPVVRA